MAGNVPLGMADLTNCGHRVLRHGGPASPYVLGNGRPTSPFVWWANEPFVWWVSVSLEMVGLQMAIQHPLTSPEMIRLTGQRARTSHNYVPNSTNYDRGIQL